jgi:hypothetical protein
MNYLDARALRYKAEADRMEESQRQSDPDSGPGPGWREAGMTKKVETVDEFATMLSGNMNRLLSD